MSKRAQVCNGCGFKIRQGFPFGRYLFCTTKCMDNWRILHPRQR